MPGNLTLSDSDIDVQLPFAAIPIVHFIPWGVGTVPIFYQFESRATLSVRNLDAAGFAAAIEADFSRTATLESVRVLDAAGGVIAGAFVVGEDGFNYSTGARDSAPLPVPVPASWLLILAAGAGLLAERLSRRGASRRQRSASRHDRGRLGHRMTPFRTMATTTPTSQGMEPGCGSVDQPEIRRAGDDLRRRAVAGE